MGQAINSFLTVALPVAFATVPKPRAISQGVHTSSRCRDGLMRPRKSNHGIRVGLRKLARDNDLSIPRVFFQNMGDLVQELAVQLAVFPGQFGINCETKSSSAVAHLSFS